MEHQSTKSQGVKNQVVTFQSLSSGIGLGDLKASSDGTQQNRSVAKRAQKVTVETSHGSPLSGAGEQPISAAHHSSPSASGVLSGRSSATTLLSPIGSHVDLGAAARRRPRLGAGTFRLVLERFMLSCGIDLLFVAISISVITFGSTLVNYARAEKGTPLHELLPLAWFVGQPVVRLLAGFFAVYLVYVVAFLVCAGGTLGSLSVRPSAKERK